MSVQYKNVSSWGNTSRYQFRLVGLGEAFFGYDFPTPKEAAFACDVCKSVLLAFGCPLDKRTKLALSDDDFTSCCRDAGLDPLNPIANADWSGLPEKFRLYVQNNRAVWEAKLRSLPSDPNGNIRYACSAEDLNVRTWAWAYKFALHKQALFNTSPLRWWGNLLKALKKSRETTHQHLTPSMQKHFSVEHSPKVLKALAELRTASESLVVAVENLEAEIANTELNLLQEFRELEASRPEVLK